MIDVYAVMHRTNCLDCATPIIRDRFSRNNRCATCGWLGVARKQGKSVTAVKRFHIAV